MSASDESILLTAKGGGIAFAGNLSSYLLRFAFGIVLARLLGADLLGLYSLSLTVTGAMGALAVLGLSAGMARYVSLASSQKDEPRLWGTIQTGIVLPSLIGVVLTIGLFLLAGPLSHHVFDRPDLAPVLRLASLGIPLLALVSVLAAITQGFKRLEYKAYAQDIAQNGLKLVLSAVLVGIGLGVMGAMTAHIVALAVAVVMLFYFVHRLFPLNRPLDTARRNTREILSFTLPLYLSRLLSQFSGSIETLMLGFFGVMSGVGIYTTVLRLTDAGTMFHHSLQRIAVPMIADLHGRGRLDQLRRVYQTTTRWGMTFNLPVFLTLALFAKPLLAIFGPGFVTGATGLVILAFGTLFTASTGVCGSMITMTGRSKLTFANSLVYLVVNLVLDLLLIPRWGALGAALAVTFTSVLINTLRIVQVLVLLRMWPYDLSFLKPIAASLVAAGVTYLVIQRLVFMPMILTLIVGILFLWAIYALVLVILKLSEEDRLVLGRLWARLGSW